MQVKTEVLQVLSNAVVEGNTLKLVEQLDRPMYTAVNKVLEAAGWKWNKKAKVHLCDGDAVDVLEQVLLTGEVTHAKNEFGFFPTPLAVVNQLIELADIHRPGMEILEPSAGTGNIALEIQRIYGVGPDCIEMLENNCNALRAVMKYPSTVTQADFLSLRPTEFYDRVVMNPPFARQADIQHVTHAFKFLKPGGRLVSVMSSSLTFRTDKRTEAFKELFYGNIHQIIPLPPGSFKASGTMVNTLIIALDKPL